MAIHTSVIPLSTAGQQELLVEISESVCRPYCVDSSIQPSAAVEFTNGTNITLNGNIVVPVTAKITITTPSSCGCGCAHVQVFTETFNVGFAPGTTNVVTLTEGGSVITSPTNVKCCKAHGIKLTTTLTVALA